MVQVSGQKRRGVVMSLLLGSLNQSQFIYCLSVVRLKMLLAGFPPDQFVSSVFAFFLFLKQFFLTTDIATVAFSQHIFRIALTVEREMICDPIAAWIATSNICRGIKSFIFRTIHAHGVRLDDDAR